MTTVQIDFWQLVVALVALVLFLGGLLLAFGKVLLDKYEKHQDERFAAVTSEITSLKQLEQRFSDWHFQAIQQFVHRDDYVRGQTVIEAKLDAIFTKHEVLQLTVANLKTKKGEFRD